MRVGTRARPIILPLGKPPLSFFLGRLSTPDLTAAVQRATGSPIASSLSATRVSSGAALAEPGDDP
jgi:hypothetical protein